uniref:Ribosome-binding ATPase YchF n=1 Tax=uncultured bacterium contig00038 TaxID=1181526 RepID=A0A806KN10_9BACT|nr:GTP-binding and nucleic acid-binding protein YchF [uncultured bacterium contig00038]
MAVRCGIVGLPGVGKSVLFNAMTRGNAVSGNFLFCTTSATTGIVDVPDARLHKLAEIVKPQKIVHATQEFVDIPGLVRGASKGEGLGNSFLTDIRDMNAIIQVVRCFENPDVPHVETTLDAARDLDVVDMELVIKDMEVVEKSLERYQKTARSGNKESQAMVVTLEKILAVLNEGKWASAAALDKDELFSLKSYCLLTQKPMLLVGNIDEKDIPNPKANAHYAALEKVAEERGIPLIPICAKFEADLAQMDNDDQAIFMEEAGLSESGRVRFIRASFALLNLQTFFTAGPKEVRAWTIPAGATAPQAAGAIHSDFERGFIRARVISFDDFMACKGEQGAKEAGKQRQEGKNYIVKDSDVVEFLFNV